MISTRLPNIRAGTTHIQAIWSSCRGLRWAEGRGAVELPVVGHEFNTWFAGIESFEGVRILNIALDGFQHRGSPPKISLVPAEDLRQAQSVALSMILHTPAINEVGRRQLELVVQFFCLVDADRGT